MNLKMLKDLGRPVLSDRTILQYNKKGLLIEQPISRTQLQPNSVDLTLAATWKKPKPNDKIDRTPIINPKKPMIYDMGTFQPIVTEDGPTQPAYILNPGEFVLMASNEILHIPNGILAFVQGRSSVARIGVQTEQAGLIDAGFRGTITFEVYNETPYHLPLFVGMRVAQLYFYKAQYSDRPYGSELRESKYQMQIDATGSRIDLDPELH